MNSPTTQHVDRALQEIQDWKAESKARELAFYVDALNHGELHIAPDKERTTRAAKCDVCFSKQAPGIRKFWYRTTRTGISSWWFHPCDACWNEMMQTADIHLLATCQVREESGQARPLS